MTRTVLGIHTATATLGLSLLSLGDRPARSQHWHLDRQMANQLHPCLAAFYPPDRWTELAAVAVAVGPGSFTGCRMGVTLARTLGQSFDLPIFGISTLAAIAHQVLSEPPSHSQGAHPTVAVQMDAKRGEWFGGIYQWVDDRIVALEADRLRSPEDWADRTKLLTAIDASHWETDPPAIALARIAMAQYERGDRPSWPTVVPFYGRHPPIHSAKPYPSALNPPPLSPPLHP